MFNIATYLEKFKNIGVKEVLERQAILTACASVNLVIPEKSITIKNNIITIQASPLVKNEIVIKKSRILAAIHTTHPKVIDIK